MVLRWWSRPAKSADANVDVGHVDEACSRGRRGGGTGFRGYMEGEEKFWGGAGRCPDLSGDDLAELVATSSQLGALGFGARSEGGGLGVLALQSRALS